MKVATKYRKIREDQSKFEGKKGKRLRKGEKKIDKVFKKKRMEEK